MFNSGSELYLIELGARLRFSEGIRSKVRPSGLTGTLFDNYDQTAYRSMRRRKQGYSKE